MLRETEGRVVDACLAPVQCWSNSHETTDDPRLNCHPRRATAKKQNTASATSVDPECIQGLPEDAVGKAMATVVGRCWHQRGSENHSLETPPYRLGHGTHQRHLGATGF